MKIKLTSTVPTEPGNYISEMECGNLQITKVEKFRGIFRVVGGSPLKVLMRKWSERIEFDAD